MAATDPSYGARGWRRRLCIALAGAALPPYGLATGPSRVRIARIARIGALWQTTPPPPPHPHVEAMLKALEERGWQEGRTAAIEYRYGGSDASRLAAFAQDLVGRNVEVIVTLGDLATRAAQDATRSVPIVAVVGFPVESGFVTSLARPGGNLTGVGVFADDLAAKRLELLKELLPRLRRVAVLWDAATHERQRLLAEEAARSLGLQAQVLAVRAVDGLGAAFDAAAAGRAEAVLVLVSPLFIAQRITVVQLAAWYRLPAMYTAQTFTEVGGLIAYGPGFDEIWRLGASVIDEILRGARPGDLPIQRPATIRVDLNLRTARELGIDVPTSIHLRADSVTQ